MKKYKVWGGYLYYEGEQFRTIIATKTKKRAVEILNISHKLSYNYFNDYWCETGNEKEIKLALSKPEIIIYMGKL